MQLGQVLLGLHGQQGELVLQTLDGVLHALKTQKAASVLLLL